MDPVVEINRTPGFVSNGACRPFQTEPDVILKWSLGPFSVACVDRITEGSGVWYVWVGGSLARCSAVREPRILIIVLQKS